MRASWLAKLARLKLVRMRAERQALSIMEISTSSGKCTESLFPYLSLMRPSNGEHRLSKSRGIASDDRGPSAKFALRARRARAPGSLTSTQDDAWT